MNNNHNPLDVDQANLSRAEQEANLQIELDQEIEDLTWLMSSQKGRRVVWRQLCQAGIFNSVFNTNAIAMANAEGKKTQGYRLMSLIHQHCYERYAPMVKEANE